MRTDIIEQYKAVNRAENDESNIGADDDLFRVEKRLEDSIGFSEEVFDEARKLFDRIEFDGKSPPKKAMFIACIRIAGIKNGEPVRTKKMVEDSEYSSSKVSQISKRIKQYEDVRLFAETDEYCSFLMDRLGIQDQTTRKEVKRTTKRINRKEQFYGIPGTSIGIAVTSIKTGVGAEDLSKITASQDSTIRKNKEIVKEALNDVEWSI